LRGTVLARDGRFGLRGEGGVDAEPFLPASGSTHAGSLGRKWARRSGSSAQHHGLVPGHPRDRAVPGEHVGKFGHERAEASQQRGPGPKKNPWPGCDGRTTLKGNGLCSPRQVGRCSSVCNSAPLVAGVPVKAAISAPSCDEASRRRAAGYARDPAACGLPPSASGSLLARVHLRSEVARGP
jgi:hypothetical protein